MSLSHQCEAEYLIKGVFGRLRRCLNKAKYFKNGKWYCGVHDPDKIEGRRKKREPKKEATRKRKRILHRAHYYFLNKKKNEEKDS